MKDEQILEEIKETNLAYLMLAQKLIRSDREQAIYRLGINSKVADLIDMLTPWELLRLAGTNLLMCTFRCEDPNVWTIISGHLREREKRNSSFDIYLATNFSRMM